MFGRRTQNSRYEKKNLISNTSYRKTCENKNKFCRQVELLNYYLNMVAKEQWQSGHIICHMLLYYVLGQNQSIVCLVSQAHSYNNIHIKKGTGGWFSISSILLRPFPYTPSHHCFFSFLAENLKKELMLYHFLF